MGAFFSILGLLQQPHFFNYPNNIFNITIVINPTAQAIVVTIEYPLNCSLASLKPKDLFTTQNIESLKYEKKTEPTQADKVANTGLTPRDNTIGAEIDADVSIATVPDP